MARCPRCRMPLGLMTSFALSNFQGPRGLNGPSPLIAFECCHCATRLTYRFETAALCWILAIAGLLFVTAMTCFWVWIGVQLFS